MALGNVTRLAEFVRGTARSTPRTGVRWRERTVAGMVPYILGLPVERVLALDAELAPGPWPAWHSAVPSARYGKTLKAPIGGVRYAARLGVQVWDERVAAVLLDWPEASFASSTDWRRASWALRDQVVATYTPEIAKGNERLHDDVLVLAEAGDAAGNRVMALSADRTISLVYLWGPFARTGPSVPVLSRTLEPAEIAAK